MKSWQILILVLVSGVVTACAQQEVYTEPYVSIGPTGYATPLPVRLNVSFNVDGKPNAKRRNDILPALGRVIDTSGAFKIVHAAVAAGQLEISIDDTQVKHNEAFLGTLSASVGHVLISQPEFTPQGRRTLRELQVAITYIRTISSTFQQTYISKLITVTNNTQDPTDLVSLHGRRHAELTLIGNDLNVFTAAFAKSHPAGL